MTPEQVEDLLVMLRGFWPHSAPEPGDPVAEAAWLAAVHEVPVEQVANAVLDLSRSGEKFCPPPGVVYAKATAKKAPASAPFPALPEGPPDTDDDSFRSAIAENRRRLEEIAREKGDQSWGSRHRDRSQDRRR